MSKEAQVFAYFMMIDDWFAQARDMNLYLHY